MAATTIESLQLEIEATSSEAAKSIDALSHTLTTLKSATKGLGLGGVTRQLKDLNTALDTVDNGNADKLNKLADGIKKLSACGGFKLSSSVAKQITSIGAAVGTLNNTDFSAIDSLGTALSSLSTVGKSNLGSFVTPLEKLPKALTALGSVDWSSAGSGISQVVSSLTPLTQMGKSNLAPFITQLSKIPKLMSNLKTVDMSALSTQVQQLANAFAPLATQMQAISAGFASFPNRIQRLIQTTNNLSRSNGRASMSYINLWAKCRMAYNAVLAGGRLVANWIHESNSYIENLNLFTVSLGEYAGEAKKYAEQVGEIMGIDPGEFMRNQGVFMTITEGFGVASDRAYIMSKNLTQLGYDLSSFFNISFTDAMQKLTSGISGELEPLRRLGYDLSEARLKAVALFLGIDKSFNSMTQAEKAQLRYYTIMKQVTVAQGDMARTLNAPANQIRILKSQIVQCARALGNIFIPVLNKVLPYCIALAKVIRLIANSIANLFGAKLPEMPDMGTAGSAVGGLADNANDAADGLGNAAKKAKEVKNALLGIDELNIISPLEDATGGGVGDLAGGAGLDFELPEYDFLNGAVASKVEEIVQKMKEWLGLTDEINSWGDFFHTKLGKILTTIGAIGMGLMAWKLSKGLMAGLEHLAKLKALGLDKAMTLSIGIALAITGVTLETIGIIDAIKNELDSLNFAQILGGGAFITANGAFIGKAIAGWITSAFSGSTVATALSTAATNLGLGTATAAGSALGAAAGGIIAGIPAFITGIYDSIVHGIDWLSAALTGVGATAAGASIGAIIGACGGPIGAGIGALIGLAVGLVTDGIILVVQKWDAITAFLKNFFTVTVPGIWNKFTSWLSSIPSSIAKFFDEAPGKISKWFDNLWQPIKDYDWYGLGHDIGEWLGNAWKKAVDFVTVQIPNYFSNLWSEIKRVCYDFFCVTLPQFFTETIPEAFNRVVEWFKKLPEELKKAWDTGKKWFIDIGKAIVDGIIEGFECIWQGIKDFCNGIVDGFKDALGIHSPSKVFAELGGFLADGLLNGLKKPFETIKKWVKTHIIDPIKKVIDKNPIGEFAINIKNTASEWWNKAKGWWAEVSRKGISINATVGLVRDKWTNVWSWVKNFGMSVINQGVDLVKSGWTKFKSVWDWVKGFGVSVYEQGVSLVKSGWASVKNVYTWVKNFGMSVIEQRISLVKSGWTRFRTVYEWVKNFGMSVIDQGINLVKGNWKWLGNVYSWVKNQGMATIEQAISLFRSGWSYVSSFVRNYMGSSISKAIGLAKDWYGSVADWIKNWWGGNVSKSISLAKGWYGSVSDWVRNQIGSAVTVTVNLYSKWKNRIKDFFGLSSGGIITSNGFQLFSQGGFLKNGMSQFWNSIPKYANGTANAGIHGSMFVAGENGAEMVGHINGQTEVLNQSQIKLAMRSAVISGMAQFTGYWRMINNQIATCTNAIIRSVLVGSDLIAAQVNNNVTYDPTNSLAQSVYEDSQKAYEHSYSNTGVATSIRDFYFECVEPTLKEIAADTKRQADKEEQTIVQVGNRTVTDAVVTQQKANGFVFAK